MPDASVPNKIFTNILYLSLRSVRMSLVKYSFDPPIKFQSNCNQLKIDIFTACLSRTRWGFGNKGGGRQGGGSSK